MTKENITERVRGGGVPTSGAPKININIPKVGSGGSGGRNNPSTTTTTPIRKINPQQFDNRSAAVTTNTPSGGSLKAGSFGISKAGEQQAAKNRAEFNKPKPQPAAASSSVSTTTRQGKERTPAQMAAAKRIASGKTIQDVKDANTNAMKKRAAKRFADFKAKREANRMKNKPQNNSGGSSETMAASYKPDMDAYDMVLEYLMSTEQAATIEEANYVMMQLDEENIQEIVGQVARVIMKTPLVKLVPAAIGTGIATKMIASKMGKKSVKPVTPPVVNTPTSDIQVGDGIEQRKKGESLMDYYKRRKNNLETQDKKLGAGEY